MSSSTPPVTLDIPEASLLANTNTHVFVRIGRSKGITTRDELAARLILDFASLTGPEVLPEWDVSDATGSEGGYVLRLAMPRSFTPGLFRLRVGMDTTPGETRAIQRMFRAINGGEAGEAPLLEQTFAMGHAAANTNRGTYLAGEALEAQMAVSDGVLPLCGSALGAELTDPAGGRQAFSIALGNLQYQKSCATRKFTVLPDYALTSPLSSPGSYALTVTPAENTGSPQAGQTLTAAVRVADGGRMLDIRRQSVTRTFPGNTEDMTVVVTPSATFIGSITERVPAGFDVVTVEPLANRTVEGDGSQTL